MPQSPDRIIELASAFYDSCILFAASDLGIFEILAKLDSASAETIASNLDLSSRGTQLLMDGCVALRLLEKEGEFMQSLTWKDVQELLSL